MSRAPKQLSAEQIAERAERVYAIESVTALAQAPEQALRYYTQLTDVKLRSAMESQWGIYIAESSKVIRRALAAGHQPVSFLMSEKWADDLADVLRAHPDTPAYVGSE
ncbi:MAG: rRNA methyltransferase, partial [Rothia mucilaginosa]